MSNIEDVFSTDFLNRLNHEQFGNLKRRTESATETDILMAMSMHENARHDWLLTDDPDLRTKILQEDGTLYRFGQVQHDDYVREPGWINAATIFVTKHTKIGMEAQHASMKR